MERRRERPTEMRNGSGGKRISPGFISWVLLPVLGACILLCARPASAQLGNHAKLPGVSKIISGSTRQAFTGTVQSLNRKQHVLNVGAGENSAIFPLKKKVKVSSVGGARLNLAALTPGTNVIIYYEQQGGHRTVNQIVILAAPAASSAKKPHSSS
ncbi:MAG: hypothetical protein ACRD2B_13015 [Terriglobia bacterium]